MLGKIFNRSSKNNFYLELNETEKTENKVETAKKAPVINSEPLPKATADSEVKTTSDSSTNQPQKQAKKDKESSNTTKSKSAEQPATSKDSGASSWEQPFWVKAMYENTSANSSANAEASETFATKHLITRPPSRRRPGPSLDKFKEMARQKKF
ncbi:MAG TPA: hypothetical protein ACFCUY_10445 [Xenococcaceae cyanobacterium]|jgi:hypothetical protein